MDFTLAPVQQDVRAAARRYLSDRYPPARVAELARVGGYDRDAWPELVLQGWFDPDLAVLDLALLAEEGGRALHPVPWLSSVGRALPAYRAAGVPLPGPATLADGSSSCRATPDGDRWRLDGRVDAVVDAAIATEIVVAAGAWLFAVAPGDPGVRLAAREGIDPLRGEADLVLTAAPARLLVGPPAARPLLRRIRHRTRVLLAAEGVGVADRALAWGVEYARTREQFGRPIGAYQAVSHPLADGYADVELARSLTWRAAAELDEGLPEPGYAVARAVHAARNAAVRVCETAVQTCGGIGVTSEFALHHWYRRALWLDAAHAGRPDPLATVAETLFRGSPGEE